MTTEEIDFHGYHDSLRRLVVLAKDMGWTVRQSKGARKGRGGIRLHSPVSAKTLSIPQSTQHSDARTKSLYRQMFAHSDRERLHHVLDSLEMANMAEEYGITDVDLSTVSTVAASMKGLPVMTDPIPVTTRPWLAKTGSELYESSAVREQVQDGVVIGYRCSSCDYEADDPKKVAAHYRGKKDEAHTHALPQAPIVAKNPDPPVPREYQPQGRLVRLLAHALQEIIDGDDYHTADDLAAAALRWVHDRPDLEHVEREPRELTDSEVLERIRALVVTDEVPRLRAENERLTLDMKAVEEKMADVERDYEVVVSRSEKAEADLSALVELVESLKR